MNVLRSSGLCALFILSAAGAFADGTTDVLIDAVAGLTISSPGSYRLVADATLTADVTGVNILASNVTLDLNGHTITGTALNTFSGIDATNFSNCTVINGRITGFGAWGITTGANATVRDCKVFGNNTIGAGGGLAAAANAIVEGCTVSSNSDSGGNSAIGIRVTSGGRVSDNVVENNVSTESTSTGISALGAGCIIENNTVRNNKSFGNATGIETAARCVIRGNAIMENDCTGTADSRGISSNTACLIEGNTCTDQTTGASGAGIATGIFTFNSTVLNNECYFNSAGNGSNGTARGINANSSSVVRGNRCEANNGKGTGTSAGIVGLASCRIEGNHCTANIGGASSWGIRITGAGNLVADNSTQGHPTGGLSFLAAANNRAHSNQLRETTGVSGAPASVGAGDLANVVY